MNQLKSFREAKKQYSKECFKEITIFVNLHKGNKLIPNDKLVYHFLFSENKLIRQNNLKQTFKNTEELYRAILQEFFDKKELISLGYDKRKKNICYQGVKLENSLEEKLNIYFSSDALWEYRKLKETLLQKKQQDFFLSASKLIQSDMVNRMVIRPMIDNSSRLIYISDNYEYSPVTCKIKQLGFYYRKENKFIDKMDLENILNLIYLFINNHLNENLQYAYRLDAKYQTEALILFTESQKSIEIYEEVLIDQIEKFGIIDDLAGIRDCPPLVEQETLRLKKE